MTDGETATGGPFASRLHDASTAHNVVVMKTVELYFQKSPGMDTGDHRQIRNLRYQVRREGIIVQAARMAADGQIKLRCPPGVTTIELMAANRVVAKYDITFTDAAIPAVATPRGQQRRLRMLGYHLGHAGLFRDGVDGTVGAKTERAILDYQADKGLAILGKSDAATQSGLTNDVGC